MRDRLLTAVRKMSAAIMLIHAENDFSTLHEMMALLANADSVRTSPFFLERAKEKYPEAKPRIIFDNGPRLHRTGLQGVHSHLGDDARANLAVLSAVEREDRTLAQVAQAGVHPAPGSFGESGRFRILRGGVAEIARVLKAKGAPGARLWG